MTRESVLASLVELTEIRVTWGERISCEELCPPDWPIDTSVGHFLNDEFGIANPL